MAEKPTVMLVITQDTKEEEGAFVRQELEAAGCEVVHLDPSIRRTVGGAEIGPEEIAAAAGTTIEEVRALGHEGKCQAVMIEGAVKLARGIVESRNLSGVLAVGGSMGTSLAGALLQTFPYGLPKLIVSTMASGLTAPYVGVKDIAMMNAVTDIAGINSISRDVFRNAARAVAGMARGYDPAGEANKPLILMTTLGTTETGTGRIRRALEADGFEVMVFHSSGPGGATLDAIAAERDVAAILDLSWTEIADRIFGGLCAGAPDRGRVGPRRGIPTIFAPGNVDFLVGGPIEQARAQFPDTRYHVHNHALTAVRTQLPQLKRIAEELAEIAGEATGPVRFFLPLHGFSSHDSPAGHLHEPGMPAPFAAHMRSVLPKHVPADVIDGHFNDPVFADAIVAATREMIGRQVA